VCFVHYHGPALCERRGAVPQSKSLPLLRGLPFGGNKTETEETMVDVDDGSWTQELRRMLIFQSMGSSSGLCLHTSRDGELTIY